MIDDDYPNEDPVLCQIEWRAGTSPPDTTKYSCENDTMRAWSPENTFNGVKDFQLQFAHTVIEPRFAQDLGGYAYILTPNSVGECPQYCYLTKYAMVNLTYPGTPNYECDTENAICAQRINTTIKAPVYLAVA